MEDFEDDADGSGSGFDSISDMSSLGSFGKQYAVKKVKDESAKKTRKTKKKAAVDPVTGLPVEKKKKTGVKKKKKVEGAEGADALTAEEKKKRKTVRESKKEKLKGVNDRVLGLDEDMEPFTTSNNNNTAHTEAQPSPMSHTAQASPLAVNTGGSFSTGASTPNRAPSPKINVLGSSRISPFIEPLTSIQQQQGAYSIAGGYAQPGVVPVPGQVPVYQAPAYLQAPTAVAAPGYIAAPATLQAPVYSTHSPSPITNDSPNTVPSLAQGIESMNIRSNESSRNSSMNNDAGMGTSSRNTIVGSAVSERRKAAAAARATKIAKAFTSSSKAPDDVVQFSGAETSPEVGAKSRKSMPSQAPSVAPIAEAPSDHSRRHSPASTANSTENDTPRRHDPLKTVVSGTTTASTVTAVTPPSSALRGKQSRKKVTVEKGDSSDSSASESSEEKRRRRKKEKESQSKKKSEADREREAERERAEARERERQALKEKEAAAEREKEREREARRKERRTRRDRGEDLSSEEPTPPSEMHLPAEPTPLSKKSPSFGRKGPEQPFCKLIKSTTYLNAIKIAHSDVPKVLCASADSSVHIYTIADGTALQALEGHTDRVISLAVSNPFMYADKSSASGKPQLKTLVASGSRDEMLRIWDMDTAKCLHSIHAHKSPIWAVGICVRPNGDVIVVSTSQDGSMRSWNGKTGKKINNFKGHTDKILSVFIMNPLSENPLVLSAGADKKIRVWELLTGAHIRMLEGHEDEINSVVAGSFSGISSLVPISHAGEGDKGHTDVAGLDSSKSTVIVSGSKDLTVRVWDFRSGHLLFELLGHSACVYEVAMMRARDSPLSKGHNAIPPGTPIIVSCSEDATIKLWNLVTGKLVKSLKYHSVSVRGIDTATIMTQPGDPHSGVSLIASCGWDKTIQFHELGEALYAKSDNGCEIM